MNQKTQVLIVGIVAIGLVVLGFVWFRNSTQTPTTSNGFTTGNTGQFSGGGDTASTIPNSNNTQASTTNTILIATSNGDTIQVKNIKKDQALVSDTVNAGYYYLGYHFNTSATSSATNIPPYVIEYIDATQYFNIALLQEPIQQTRQEAEQYLMAHLGITANQMCQLKYMVSVPARVNASYSGTNLGFSFCPGAVQL